MSTGRLLARNSALSLAGHLVPLGVALIALPPLIRGLGADRFAILALAWAMIGYLGVFELGLSRALTQAIAKRLGGGATNDLGALVWTTLTAMVLLGMLAGILVAAVTPALVLGILNVPRGLTSEAIRAFYILASSLPFVIGSIGLRAVMEAHQDFGIATAIRIPIGSLMFLGPLVAMAFSHSLALAVSTVAAARMTGFLLHMVYCMRRYEYLQHGLSFDARVLRPLLWYGAWSTVTNIVSPIMVVLDRFLIAAVLPLAAVAHYVTPYEAVTKLLVIPIALLSAMFPAFSAVANRDPERMSTLYDLSLRIVTIVMFPLALTAIALAQETLGLWVGSILPPESAIVLQWLAAGVFINAIAQPPLNALQGAGRPDLIAKLHLAELPFYLIGLVLLARAHGLAGVAIAWTLRVAVDALALLLLARRTLRLPLARSSAFRFTIPAMLMLFVICASIDEVKLRLICIVFTLLAFAPGAWLVLLTSPEREALRYWTRNPRQPSLPQEHIAT